MALLQNLDPDSLIEITPIVKEEDPATPGEYLITNRGVPMHVSLAEFAAWVLAQAPAP